MSDVNKIAAAFNRHPPGYDTLRRSLIPCFDAFYGTVVTLASDWAADKPLRVLDLGAGTGLLGSMIMDRFPSAQLHLLDASQAMLDQARERFRDEENVSFLQGDMVIADLGGPYDLVVSALAIHHLSHDAKRNLFARIRKALVPGGMRLRRQHQTSMVKTGHC